MPKSWQERAQEKQDAILAAIPKEWRIDNPPVEEQVDVTGKYVHQFLSDREIEITETTAEGIVGKIAKGEWKSEEVAKAFCHRAGLAHQLVSRGVLEVYQRRLTYAAPLSPRSLLRRSYC
jgi:amidase